MHIANCYTIHQPDAVITTSSSLNSTSHAASSSDKTSTLMIILTDRLRLYLKPDQNLSVEVPYSKRECIINIINVSKFRLNGCSKFNRIVLSSIVIIIVK